MEDVDNIELTYLDISDYEALKEAMVESYTGLANAYWTRNQVETLINQFPDGQVAIKVNGQIAGVALSIIVESSKFDHLHTYKQITGNYTFNTHRPGGNILYGIDVFIKKEFRGLRLGRRLYDYRKELCEKLNLKGIAFGGRLPNYHLYAKEISPREYIEKVKRKEIHDPVLDFQMSNDFHPSKILKNYLEGDSHSKDYAVLLESRCERQFLVGR